MEKVLCPYTGKLIGYKIGDHIEIYKTISDKDFWYFKCDYLSIRNQVLCPRDYTEEEVRQSAEVVLTGKLNEVKYRFVKVLKQVAFKNEGQKGNN